MPTPHNPRRRAQVAFTDTAAKQLDAITSEAELPALDRTLVVISVDPTPANPSPAATAARDCASTSTTSNGSASCTG